MGDNIAYVETFSIEEGNPSVLGLQNDNFQQLDLQGTNDELQTIPYNLLLEVKSTLETLILSHNHFEKLGEKVGASSNHQTNKNIFPRMEKLLSLELDNCHIINIRAGAFDGFPILRN